MSHPKAFLACSEIGFQFGLGINNLFSYPAMFDMFGPAIIELLLLIIIICPDISCKIHLQLSGILAKASAAAI